VSEEPAPPKPKGADSAGVEIPGDAPASRSRLWSGVGLMFLIIAATLCTAGFFALFGTQAKYGVPNRLHDPARLNPPSYEQLPQAKYGVPMHRIDPVSEQAPSGR